MITKVVPPGRGPTIALLLNEIFFFLNLLNVRGKYMAMMYTSCAARHHGAGTQPSLEQSFLLVSLTSAWSALSCYLYALYRFIFCLRFLLSPILGLPREATLKMVKRKVCFFFPYCISKECKINCLSFSLKAWGRKLGVGETTSFDIGKKASQLLENCF